MKLVVCLGGTGQLVLHNYLQLYLLGLVDGGTSPTPLRAVVIDPDQPSLMRSLLFIADLFAGMSLRGQDPFGLPAPWIRIPRVEAPAGGSLENLLTAGDPDPLHPARGYFDPNTLAQGVNVGLFGRPSLAPSLWQDESWGGQARKDLDDAVQACGGPTSTRAVVVASLLGGTGGGLTIPVLDHLIRRLHVSQVSAILFGPYFHCTQEQAQLYDSNWIALGNEVRERYRQDGVYSIRRLGLLGAEPSGLRKRDPGVETQARQMPWPTTDGGKADPVAEACWAITDALNNLVPAAPPTPEAAVISVDHHRAEIHDLWRQAHARRDQALAALAYMMGEGFFGEAAADVFGRYLYGSQLLDFLEATLVRYAQATGPARDFWAALTRELRQIWSGRPYALDELFPPVAPAGSRHELRRRAQRLPQPKLGAAVSKQEVIAVAARGLLMAILRS